MLQITDGNRLLTHLKVYALALALLLLRAYAAADSGQGAGVLEHLGGSQIVTALNILDE